MSANDDEIISKAAGWHAAIGDDAADWSDFTAWLEADPRHALAYEEIALFDSLIDDHRPTLLAQSHDRAAGLAMVEREARIRARPTWRLWAGAGMAASLVAAFLGPRLLHPATVYETGSQSRRIALADGSKVTLAPHSRLSVDGRDRDRLALTGGAWFEIRHDPERALAITAGDVEIRDIGTSFDVQTESKTIRVGVAEGEVTVASQALAQPIRLQRGRGLLFDSAAGTALIKAQDAPAIGSWRTGRLSYDDTPLPLVLDDLSRYAEVRVTLPESLRNRRFSGSLIIGDGEAAIRDLAQVMDLSLRRSGDGYRLDARSR